MQEGRSQATVAQRYNAIALACVAAASACHRLRIGAAAAASAVDACTVCACLDFAQI